jgi:hypothetical protein
MARDRIESADRNGVAFGLLKLLDRRRRAGSDIRRWTIMSRGGHFAAMGQPEALAAEV